MTQEVTNFDSCPYCGKINQTCSDITSEARENSRAFCSKKNNYEPIEELSTWISEDLELGL